MRAPPDEYRRIDLRAHELLAGVPLHDVWAIDLDDRRHGRGRVDLRNLLSLGKLARASVAVRALFALRAALGSILGWDREPPGADRESFAHRLSAADRESTLVAPGTKQGAFRVLFVSPREAITEIRNSTVHAFSVLALVDRSGGHRLYWAIYVRPIGRITGWYMRLIDPFRRLVVYPAVLRHVREAWSRGDLDASDAS